MSPYRYRDDDSSIGSVITGLAIGALTGFAVGVAVAQQVGGISGIAARLRERFGGTDEDDLEEYEEDEYDDAEDEAASELEERVLEAFRNDPILSERPVDIGAIGEGIIELSGWVESTDESEHATVIARGVPGVDTVVNRIGLGEEDGMDDELDDREARKERVVDDLSEPLEGGRWEGNRIGTGRRRQGTSDEVTRHADPKPELEDRWLSEEQQIRDAAEDIENIKAGRRRGGGGRGRGRSARGGRTDGSPIAPTGVPKADHVVDPQSVDPDDLRAD
ncbi:MAG TPA: BON domain-containing protein [Gemmatimonadaceae bacterium]|nr:BON domain-containing protein [Gemmatimonadaceae bacterium]